MNIFFDIALRYLFGRKSTNAINIITGISVLGISIGTAALILILSVFNGFESLIKNFVDDFNPDLKVQPIEGKRFLMEDSLLIALYDIDGIDRISKTLEEVALFEYEGSHVGVIKGVDDEFRYVTAIDSTIKSGSYVLESNGVQHGVAGVGLSRLISINVMDPFTPMTVYIPKRKRSGPLDRKDFTTRSVYPKGEFTIANEKDNRYYFCSLALLESMLKLKGYVSALEIKLKPEADEETVAANIKIAMGDAYTIKNRYEQEATYFKVMNIEKWMSALIASLAVLLMAFNIIGSLWMIVLEKKKDIAILKSMGSTSRNIKQLVLNEGLLITCLGLFIGVVLALIIYYGQINYDLISMNGSYLVNSYPIKLKLSDFFIVFAIVFTIGFMASLLPAGKAAQIPALVRDE